jgi:hypothetical protein
MTDGGQAPTYYHNGENYVMGQRGQRYTLRIHNHSNRRVEAVVSVDGRDVVDGRTADFRSKRGYLVQPWGYVDVDGWRVSQGEAAAFRFSSVANSYVGRTGSAREVGVIGRGDLPGALCWRRHHRLVRCTCLVMSCTTEVAMATERAASWSRQVCSKSRRCPTGNERPDVTNG